MFDDAKEPSNSSHAQVYVPSSKSSESPQSQCDLIPGKNCVTDSLQWTSLSQRGCDEKPAILTVEPTRTPPRISDDRNILPPYMQPVPARIHAEDFQYLRGKGVFTVPGVRLRNELLTSYARFVDPFLPILEFVDILTTVQENHSHSISLFVFQAIMFAGISHVDIVHLRTAGYTTRKEAQQTYFNKLKLLYDFDYETDQITTLQAVLLMTCWYGNLGGAKDAGYWLDVAISIAKGIGLHNTSKLCERSETRLWKRIWWSCLIRDQLVALDLCCPPRLNLLDFDLPNLKVTDFDTNDSASARKLVKVLDKYTPQRETADRTILAKLFITLTQLFTRASKMDQLLHQTFQENGHSQRMDAIQRKRYDLIQFDHQLNKWYRETIQENKHLFCSTSSGFTDNDKIVDLHRGLLAAIFLTITINMHRPVILDCRTNMPAKFRQISRTRLGDAANKITDIYQNFRAHNLMRNLPYTGITCLLSVINVHMHDRDSTGIVHERGHTSQLTICVQALEELVEEHSSAAFVISVLGTATHQSQYKCSSPSSSESPKDKTSNAKYQSEIPVLTPPETSIGPEQCPSDQSFYLTTGSVDQDESRHNTSLESSTSDRAPWQTPVERNCRLDHKILNPEDITLTEFEVLANLQSTANFTPSFQDAFDVDMRWLEEHNL
ncbi:Fungal specific transcription factor domain-containing protein [Cladophialophora immunda]|nr:Fungal specific transcription factor domain-containing protein [Cladophialophora immunda]